MSIKERKERQREALRRKILSTAEKLFVKEGYEHVSMRKIAEIIEYSPTTIYRLFKNKEEIMNQLIADGYLGVYQQYLKIINESGGSPLETLNKIISSYVEFALKNPNHYELWFSTSEIEVIDGRLHMRHGHVLYKVFYVWLDRIEECKKENLFRGKDTLSIFQLIWGSVHGLISLRIHHQKFPWMPLKEHVRELLLLLNNGLK